MGRNREREGEETWERERESCVCVLFRQSV